MATGVFGEIGFMGMLTTVSALQGFVLGGFLMLRPRDEATLAEVKAVRWLALMMMLLSLHLADMTFSKTELIRYFARAADATFCVLFLIGPIYYLYVRTLLHPERKFHLWEMAHGLPALYILIDMVPWIMTDPELKIAWQIRNQGMQVLDIPVNVYFKLSFNILQNMTYLWLSLSLLKLAKARLSAHSSDGAISQGLAALQTLTRGFAGWVAFYFVVFLSITLWGEFGARINQFWLFVNGLFIQAAGFTALVRPALFGSVMMDTNANVAAEAVSVHTVPALEDNNQKYSKSTLNEAERGAIKRAFEKLMTEERPYLDAGLRMPEVAAKIDASTHHLSQMLNQDIGTSFLGIINRYRVAEVKALMADFACAAQTVLTLAFDAGFNNKSSFNRAFREETGETPTAYRKRIQRAGQTAQIK